MSKKILIVGNAKSQHLYNLVLNVKKNNHHIRIDILNLSTKSLNSNSVFDNVYECKKSLPSILYKIPVLSSLFYRFFDLKIALKNISEKYDLVNIHYVTIDTYFMWDRLKKISDNIMLSPWGSDVYRVKNIFIKKIKTVYDKCTYVSVPKIKFRNDIIDKFSIDQSKIIDLGFGSSIIDKIIEFNSMGKTKAKRILNFENKFIITCGYNASELQNHSKIIDSINAVKGQLKIDINNIILLLPMTYGGNNEYINNIEKKLQATNLPYKIYNNYLQDSEVALLRGCSDVFIHAQPTDAFSGSLQEYLLTDNQVINGKWTRYPDLEKFGEVPYHVFNDFDELKIKIVNAVNHEKLKISKELKDFICEQSWVQKGKQWTEFYSKST